VAQVAFQAEVAIIVVQVHLCNCISSVTAKSVLCRIGKEDSHSCDFQESLLRAFLLPQLPGYAQKIQLITALLLGLQREFS
jgi:hypothetical protein